jgi:hypothetical protein
MRDGVVVIRVVVMMAMMMMMMVMIMIMMMMMMITMMMINNVHGPSPPCIGCRCRPARLPRWKTPFPAWPA